MNKLRIAVFGLLPALVCSVCTVGQGGAQSWEMAAFDKANKRFAELNSKEKTFVVSIEPNLKRYYSEIYEPYRSICEQLRRKIFKKKLESGMVHVEMRESPYVWALTTPSKEECLKLLLDDNDRRIIDSYVKLLELYNTDRAALIKVNDILEKHANELSEMENILVNELNIIHTDVLARLEVNPASQP